MNKVLPDLSHFIGSDEIFRHWTGIRYTEGIECVAKACGAYWLIDIVASAQVIRKVKAEEFQIWLLIVTGTSAVVTCRGDTDWPVVYEQKIESTDFPPGELRMYFENRTLCLPSER